MQRNANMLKILKKVLSADFIGFFAKIQSPVCPPERTFVLRQNFVIHYIPISCRVLNGRKKYSASGSDPRLATITKHYY